MSGIQSALGLVFKLLDTSNRTALHQHKVRPDETMSSIAADHGVPLQDLIAHNRNRFRDPDIIRAGQIVEIPNSQNGKSYRVKDGDNLDKIARDHGTTWQALKSYNKLSHAHRIFPGDIIRIPSGHVSDIRPSTPPRATSTSRAQAPNVISNIERQQISSGGAALQKQTAGHPATMSENGVRFLFRLEAQDGVSNRLHWPKGASGVTLGPGYDMKGRTPEAVTSDLISIGVSEATAKKVAKGAGLSGAEAQRFCSDNRSLVALTNTQEMALIQKVLPAYERVVRENLTASVSQKQFDALVSFAYNIGPGQNYPNGKTKHEGFVNSEVLISANAGRHSEVPSKMMNWIRSGGEVSNGLINRRTAEGRLYNEGVQYFVQSAAAREVSRSSKPHAEARFVNPTGNDLRNDSGGSGAYGASRRRSSGPGKHHGIDILSTPGQNVKAPISGTLKISNPQNVHSGFKIVSDDGTMEVKVFYAKPDPSVVGRRVSAGDNVATAQDLQMRGQYPSNVRDHVHLEVKINKQYVDPTPMVYGR